jgi:CHASE2 domain-containing sensor protein
MRARSNVITIKKAIDRKKKEQARIAFSQSQHDSEGIQESAYLALSSQEAARRRFRVAVFTAIAAHRISNKKLKQRRKVQALRDRVRLYFK